MAAESAVQIEAPATTFFLAPNFPEGITPQC